MYILSYNNQCSAFQKVYIQYCSNENQQSPVYVVNSYFSRRPDGWRECCHNFALLNHLYHIWELSYEVLFNTLSKGVSKYYWPKLKVLLKSKFRSLNFYVSVTIWSPFRYRLAILGIFLTVWNKFKQTVLTKVWFVVCDMQFWGGEVSMSVTPLNGVCDKLASIFHIVVQFQFQLLKSWWSRFNFP